MINLTGRKIIIVGSKMQKDFEYLFPEYKADVCIEDDRTGEEINSLDREDHYIIICSRNSAIEKNWRKKVL